MMDIGFSDLKIILLMIAILSPGLIGGAVIGAVALHFAIGERWWIGLVPGAALGTAVWFAYLRYA